MADKVYRMHVRMPEEYRKEIKKLSYEQDVTLNDVVVAIIEKFMQEKKRMLTVPKTVA